MVYFIIWAVGAILVAAALLLAIYREELVIPRDFKNLTVGFVLIAGSWISVLSFLVYLIKDKFNIRY